MADKKGDNYEERTRVWKEQLLVAVKQHEDQIVFNSEKATLLQRENQLMQKSIDLLNDEIEFADKELSK